MKDSFVIKKISLDQFLDVLTDLYYKGVNFIDITGNMDDERDEIGIHFTKEYMATPEELEGFEIDIELENQTNIKLSDEGLNELL